MEGVPSPIRVLLAEDNRDLAVAVRALLEAEGDITVTSIVMCAADLLDSIRATRADVVILDLNLDGGSSVPAVKQARIAMPDLAVVVFSGYDARDVASALHLLGDAEFVTKNGEVTALIDAVRRATTRRRALT
jgi:DNA-binding NarL/FixJ family response regulator